jgi:hypothetical protein
MQFGETLEKVKKYSPKSGVKIKVTISMDETAAAKMAQLADEFNQTRSALVQALIVTAWDEIFEE